MKGFFQKLKNKFASVFGRKSAESVDEFEDRFIDEEGEDQVEAEEVSDEEHLEQTGEIPLPRPSRLSVFIRDLKTRLMSIRSRRELKPKKYLNSSFSSDLLAKINWEKFYNILISPEHRPLVHRSFVALSLVGIFYFTGKTAALFLTPPAQEKRQSMSSSLPGPMGEDIQIIAQKDLFGASGLLEGPKVERPKDTGPKICDQATAKSSLPIKLVNTTVLQDSVKSIASVQVRGNKDMVEIREGDKVENMAEVGKIDRLKLIFKNLQTGQCEFVSGVDPKDEKPSPISFVSPREGQKIIKEATDSGILNQGNSFKIKKNVRDDALKNIGEILTQARAIQIKNPDGSLCFKMTEVVPGSIYSKLNIQDEDIICSINGKKIENLNEVMNLFGRIRDIDHFELSVQRNGIEQNLEYDFE
ncbi:MAG: hypothetical protein Fur0010_12000 [Bdellovibrio sp.]